MGRARAAVLAALASWRPVLHVCAILGGWAALTAGIAGLTVPAAWWISLGLLLLSAAGWGHLRVLASVGLYALRRKAGD